MKRLFSKLGIFNYTVHNLIAHPLMELLHLIGLTELGDKVHDMTLPSPTPLPTPSQDQENVNAEDRVKELEQKLSNLEAELEPYREVDRLYSEWFSCMGVPHNWDSTIEITLEDLHRKISDFKDGDEIRRNEIRAEFKRNLP